MGGQSPCQFQSLAFRYGELRGYDLFPTPQTDKVENLHDLPFSLPNIARGIFSVGTTNHDVLECR